MNQLHCISTLLLFCSIIAGSGSTNAQCPTLVWADEFSGSGLDGSKWNYQLGTGCDEGICGWGNNELQYYQQENVTVSNGQLQITAKKERVRSNQYTSGRINTATKAEWTYGRFEARIKLPAGGGLWPAFWMLPTDYVYGEWPQSGEIDIMEFVGHEPNKVLGTIHYGDPYPNNQFQGNNFVLNSGNFYDDYHEFAIEWEANEIRWFVDGNLYSVKTNQDVAPYNWPFDQNFHFLLNVAVGGNLGGTVDDSIFPATMEVDYVRVYNGFKPYISGNRTVPNNATNETYSIGNVSGNANVTWAVPAGATIVSGQGTPTVTINWGGQSGDVIADVSTGCGVQQLAMNVFVEPPYVKAFSFENFDAPATATLSTYTGTHTEITNPAPGGLNTSALSGEYTRNNAELYDVLVYNVSNISDASTYVDGTNKFYIDVYTSAPIGTEILLQLETPDATPTNYPTGRHSRFVGTATENNNWQRIAFSLLDRPDPGASDAQVSSLILLFASNTYTGDTYYYDNFDSYTADNGGGANQPPTVSVTSPAGGTAFTEGTVVTITADAADADGSVVQVEFFVDGNSVGTDNTSPYAIDWTIGLGSFSLTAAATDDEAASTTSAPVSITGESAGAATSMHVASITTGTVSAGQGFKHGSATVTIQDNLGNTVSGATVNGTFSGTFSESTSGVTASDGTVTFVTVGTAKGSVVVDLCVDNVSHATLTYDAAQNTITCTAGGARPGGGSARPAVRDSGQQGLRMEAYPNPFLDELRIHFNLIRESTASVELYTTNGIAVRKNQYLALGPGMHTLILDTAGLAPGVYFLQLTTGQQESSPKMVIRH